MWLGEPSAREQDSGEGFGANVQNTSLSNQFLGTDSWAGAMNKGHREWGEVSLQRIYVERKKILLSGDPESLNCGVVGILSKNFVKSCVLRGSIANRIDNKASVGLTHGFCAMANYS